MSTTPRTDAQILRYRASTLCPSEEVRFEGSQVVPADFARELECENARLREALDRIVALGARMPEDSEEVCIAKAALSPAIPDSKP